MTRKIEALGVSDFMAVARNPVTGRIDLQYCVIPGEWVIRALFLQDPLSDREVDNLILIDRYMMHLCSPEMKTALRPLCLACDNVLPLVENNPHPHGFVTIGTPHATGKYMIGGLCEACNKKSPTEIVKAANEIKFPNDPTRTLTMMD